MKHKPRAGSLVAAAAPVRHPVKTEHADACHTPTPVEPVSGLVSELHTAAQAAGGAPDVRVSKEAVPPVQVPPLVVQCPPDDPTPCNGMRVAPC